MARTKNIPENHFLKPNRTCAGGKEPRSYYPPSTSSSSCAQSPPRIGDPLANILNSPALHHPPASCMSVYSFASTDLTEGVDLTNALDPVTANQLLYKQQQEAKMRAFEMRMRASEKEQQATIDQHLMIEAARAAQVPIQQQIRVPAKQPRVVIKKKNHKKHKSRVLKEIKKLQLSTNHVISAASFQRLVREIALNMRPDIRFQSAALGALQEAAEYYLTHLFENSNLCAVHARRITVMPKDLQLALKLERHL